MSKFHQTNQWRKLAKDHKTIKCDCGSKDDIQSAHYLPQKHYPMMRLWKINLYYSCGDCNRKLGDKIYWSIRAIQLLGIYHMIKLMKKFVLAALIIFAGRLLWLDLAHHPFDSTFSYQILSEVQEYADILVAYLDGLRQPSQEI